MKKTIAFIGGGNMAKAIIHGILAQEMLPPAQIHVSGPHPENLSALADRQINVHQSNRESATKADIIVLSVKPNIIPTVLAELYDQIDHSKLIISIANGISLRTLQDLTPPATRIVRAMPNTPASVGEGMTGLCHHDTATLEDIADASEIFQSCGTIEWVDESLLEAIVGIAGSSPAYFFVMLEAMADAAVKSGMKRQMAYRVAAQAMLGSAKLALHSGAHPGVLKDEVCSPGGATIEAVQALEDNGFRSAVMAAVLAATDHTKN